jgi:hypothetical protein
MSDVYISVDIEADGPIPGVYSMLAIGLCVAGTFDGTTYEMRDPAVDTFYRELQPASDEVDTKALLVSGLDRDQLIHTGANPAKAVAEAAAWVRRQSGSHRPVLVGYPLVFDWMFLHWYFVRYCGESPFGFSGGLDMKSIYQSKARVTIDRAGRNDLPEELASTGPHTHNALDDAIEQAQIFSRLFTWRESAACD